MASNFGVSQIFSMIMDLAKSNEQCDSLKDNFESFEISDTSEDDYDGNDLDIILEENIIEEKIKGLSLDENKCNDDISDLIGLPKREEDVYDVQLKVVQKALEQNRKLKKMLQSFELELLLLKREFDRHEEVSSTSDNKPELINVDFYGSFTAPYFKWKGFSCPANLDQKEKENIKPKLYEVNDDDVFTNWEERELNNLEQLIKDTIVEEYLDIYDRVKNEQDSEHQMMVINDISFIRNADLPDIYKRYDENKLDWDKISSNFVNHSGQECKLIWNFFLKPTIKKEKWTRKEEDKLVKAAKVFGYQNWDQIAIKVGSTRTAFQCFCHYQQHLSKVKKNKWSEEELNYFYSVLNNLFISGESINWCRTKYFIDNADFISLYNKWYKNRCISNEKLRKGKFDTKEDRIILSAIKKGVPLQHIHHYLQLRNSCQIRERYRNCLDVKDRKYGIWTPEEDALLLKLVKKYGEGRWAEMATHFKSRSRTQIRQHYNNLKTMITKNPNIDLEKIARRKNIYSTDHITKKFKYTKNSAKDLRVVASEADFIKTREDLELVRHFICKKLVFRGRQSVEETFSSHSEAIFDICKALNFKLSRKNVTSFGASGYRKHLHNYIFGSIQFFNNRTELSNCSNFELGDSISILPPNLVTVSSLRNILSRLEVEKVASKKKVIVENNITKTKGISYQIAVEDWCKRMFILFSSSYILEGLDIEPFINKLKNSENQDIQTVT